MDKVLSSVKRLCEAYLDNAKRGKAHYSAESWWSGYHTGQKTMAETLLAEIEKETN